MRKAGARTLAQDEASCVVYGMPKQALLNGGAERVVPLNQMARVISGMLANMHSSAAAHSHAASMH